MTRRTVNLAADDEGCQRRIGRCGVRHNGVLYRSPELDRVVGRTGRVRAVPDDPSHIWVFVDNQPVIAWHEDTGPTDVELLLRRR